MRDYPQTMAMQQLQGSGAGQMNVLTEIIAAANKDRDIANARIEALEAALREIANDPDYGGHRAQVYKLIAQHALAPEQEK
jgi:hypothetical protein